MTTATTIERTAAALDEAADPRPWLVMFSGSPWQAAAHRQQALARELAGDYRVLFVDPPSNRPRWHFAVCRRKDALWQASVPSPLPLGRQLPVSNILGRRVTARRLRSWLDERPGPRLLWVDEDLAAPVIGRLGEAALVYDATDLDWTFTRPWNRWHLRRALRIAARSADLVVASSAALPPRLPVSRQAPVVVPNACDPGAFCPEGPVAPWLQKLPKPRLAYLGAIDTRAFDAELVAAVAWAHPEWTFVLVGNSTAAGRAPLRRLPNLRLVDSVPYEDAPAVLRGCDVGLIPYRVGGLIDYVHPKKLFEFLAVGLPVVATPLPALTTLNAPLHLANTPATFARAVGTALRQAHDPAEIDRRRQCALQNSWAARGRQLRTVLKELCSASRQVER